MTRSSCMSPRLLWLPAAALMWAASAQGIELHVPDDFPTIQAALDAADDGDTVLVAPGYYQERVRFPPREIHLRSLAGPAETVIDGDALGTVVTFEGSPGMGAILEGFTITNGLDPDKWQAGGIHVGEGGSPVIRGNVIRQNRGYGRGHGISLEYALAPLIEDNEIRHNRGGPGQSGGGGGGGIGAHGSACGGVQDCEVVIRRNYIAVNAVTTYSSGGGIYLNGARAAVVGNVIEFNSASSKGGGLDAVNGGVLRIEGNLFRENAAGHQGGAVAFSVSIGDLGPRVVNNTFVHNIAPVGSVIHAAGFYEGSLVANNVVVAEGPPAAVECFPSGTQPPLDARRNLVHAPASTAFAAACAVAPDAGNLFDAPQFRGEDDFRLLPTSPGIDAGDNDVVREHVDLGGALRIVDGDGDGVALVDLGAYEYPGPTVFADGFEVAE
jgi:hypothetical protein